MNAINLEEKAKQIRADILKMLYTCQSGHPGGSLSCVEMLMAIYYKTAHIDAKNSKMDKRDRIVLSKGHAAPTLYAILADLEFFPREDLWHLRQIDSHLQGHPDMNKTPGVDVNTGSLGQGISVAIGMALAAKHKKEDHKIYVIVGDGEVQEGLVWEAAMSAAHYKLDNLIVMLDHNGLQIDGANDEVMSIGDISEKYKAFGFECYKVDGHDIDAITYAIKAPISGKPKFICCETHKGHGISFMSDQFGWHGKAPTKAEYERALDELGVEV
ncbi:1-deoxy-D-xylulose-5-phosphate synthase N-terminal domain-containing protein [Cellulosilyticum sp. I15G10I2]|uniref:transketolase n=1 Tax=Cellulosilyticum sp. I15G10I2 TaxID=1892843 RepID=UPI000A85D334|nr:1-deoxy-D-xylulose-5-phosphate synthase N-terminal domain-containing protein [Cellulosilyticum sp. I15G10I2]